MKNDLVSVIIPCYNSEKFIGETIQSVINQKYNNIEILVVDDGSTDDSKYIIQSFDDPRIKYIYQKNSGLSASRNKGMSMANGKYFAFLDSDDLWHSDKLKKQKDFLDYCDFVFTDYYMINKDGDLIKHKDLLSNRIKKMDYKTRILNGNFILGSGSSVIFNCKVFETIGGFNINLLVGEDWEYWARVIWNNFKIGYVNERLVIIRVLSNSMQRSASYKKKYEAYKKKLHSFLDFKGINDKQKSIIHRKLLANSYLGRRPFRELWEHYNKSIAYEFKSIIDYNNLRLLIKYYLRIFYLLCKK